ncbi:hypothetical protein VTK26DRAFT_7773 [Humicola hyalothermophila]
MAPPSALPSSESLRCQASIEASLAQLTFSHGRPSLPFEDSLSAHLEHAFNKTTGIFNLHDPHSILLEPSALEQMLAAIFSGATASLGLVTGKLEEEPSEHDRTVLYLQAVAGMVAVFRCLYKATASGAADLSADLFARQLRLFAEGEQRRVVLDGIAARRDLFSCSYTSNHLVEAVSAVVEGREAEEEEEERGNGMRRQFWGVTEEISSDIAAWDGDRPCKNMGLPWGFTIMALN